MDDRPYYPSSSSSSSMAMTRPRPSDAPKVQPPRPPNAWILFRSDMSRKMAKGAGTPQQSQVSKSISQMWKDATPDVKAEYERRAEAKKREHAEKYPDYRFQPLKKEDKERLKVEKKAQREASRGPTRHGRSVQAHRYAPYESTSPSTPASAAPSPSVYANPNAALFPGHADVRIHGAFGPTPPMSAASSPASDGGAQDDRYDSPFSVPTLPEPQDFPSPRGDAFNQSYDSYDYPPLHPSTPVEPSPYTSEQTHVHDWESLVPQAIAPGYLTLDVPASSVPGDQSWGSTEFDDTLQGLMANTANPSVFAISGFDPDTITPTGQINLSVQNYTFDPSVFEGFDFSALLDPPEGTLADRVPSNGSNSSSHFDVDQYLNLDHGVQDMSYDPSAYTSQHIPSPAPTLQEQVASQSSYVPPAGAAHSSTRRVGGSWQQFRIPSTGSQVGSPMPYSVATGS